MNYAIRVVGAAMLLATSASISGCGGGEAEPVGAASPAPTERPTTPSVEPTPTAASDAWRDRYDQAQLAAFDEALGRFTEYETRSAPIWEAGEVTPAAEELFQEYFPSPAWQQVRDRLKTYGDVQVVTAGTPTVLSSRAARIALSATGGSVSIKQCADYTTVQTSQYGRPVPRDAAFSEPVERTITLKKSAGSDWLIFDFTEPTVDRYRRCGPGAEQ